MTRDAKLPEIMAYFGTTDRPVTPVEMKAFWGPLSDDEKAFYKKGVGEILGLQA